MKKILIFTLLCAVITTSCKVNSEWESYFDEKQADGTASLLIEELEEVKEISLFVEAMKLYKLDTIFSKERLYTVLAPSNEAFNLIKEDVKNDPDQMKQILMYHCLEGQTYYDNFTTGELYTLAKKIIDVRFDSQNEVVWGNGARSLYINKVLKSGILHIVDKVSYPSKNLYEFIAAHPDMNGIQDYINLQKDLIFDVWESEIVAYTPTGEPIYDSVFIEKNIFLLTNPIDQDNEEFTLIVPDNLSEIETRIKGAATFYGELPEGFFSRPVLNSLLFRGAFTPEDFNEEMKSVTGEEVDPNHLLGAYGQEELSNGYFYYTKNYNITTQEFFAERVLDGKEIFNSTYLTGDLSRFEFYASTSLLVNYISGGEATDEALGAFGSYIPETSPAYNRSVNVLVGGQQFLPVKYKLYATLDLYKHYLGGYDIYINDEPTLKFDYPATYLDDPEWTYGASVPGINTYHEFELGEFTLEELQNYLQIRFTLTKRHESGTRGFTGDEYNQYLFIRNIRIVPILND